MAQNHRTPVPVTTARVTAPVAALAVATALALSACSVEGSIVDPGTAGTEGGTAAAGLTIAAGFYPLEYVARAVGGDATTVIGLAQPGVEAHDLELSPAQVRQISGADAVLYLAEFQPAVDAAVASVDVATVDASALVEEHDHAEDSADEDDHAEEDHADDDHDHGDGDPHFWLDPTLLAKYGHLVAEQLSALDPDGAATYAANAQALEDTLAGIDQAYVTGLAQCERDTIVVAHEAFGYLTERYGLHQEGFAGLNPDAEPSPARLLEIKEIIGDSGTTVIFTENEVSARVAQALAKDVGVDTAVLSPIETVTGDDDYASVMTSNLDQLRNALACA